MVQMFDISGRTIWVVGGAGHLGASTVRLLSDMGAHVVCVDLAGRAERLVKDDGLEGRVTPVTIDVSDAIATACRSTAFRYWGARRPYQFHLCFHVKSFGRTHRAGIR